MQGWLCWLRAIHFLWCEPLSDRGHTDHFGGPNQPLLQNRGFGSSQGGALSCRQGARCVMARVVNQSVSAATAENCQFKNQL